MEAQQGSPMSMLFIFIIFGLIFYFMIYRPQAKRNKEQKLMSELTKGTEVLTAGGIIGKITKVVENSDSIVIALNDSTEVTINRNYIAAVLPKGTIKTL